MRNNLCAYILIIADRNINYIDRTIESILAQTIDPMRLRVLMIDNASNDGTYQKLIDYEIKYPQMISVLRVKKPTTRGRLLKRMIEHLRYSSVACSMLMDPGDIIYPDFMEKCTTLMRLRGARCIACETDIWDGSSVKQQIPIYTDNCILNSLCRISNFRDGIGHSVQILFKELPIGITVKLPYYAVVAEHKEWFLQLFYLGSSRMYLKQPMGCIYKTETEDVITSLIRHTFFLKREFYAVETSVFSTMEAEDREMEEIKAGYHHIAIMALQFAVEKLKKQEYKQAEDCLIYAEMICFDIVEEELYMMIKKAVDEKWTTVGDLEALLLQESVVPPRESFVF